MAVGIKLTYPIYHHVNRENFGFIPSFINKYQFRNTESILNFYPDFYKMDRTYHSKSSLISASFVNDESIFLRLNNEFKFLDDKSIYSCHLNPSCLKVVQIEDRYWPVTRTLAADEIFEIAYQNIKYLKSNIHCQIAVENTNFYLTGAYECICEPDRIKLLVEMNDIGFVFDLAHAQISAKVMGMNFSDYLKKLPIERCVEIHLSKPDLFKVYDSHGPIDSESYSILDNILARIKSDVDIVIEYYQDFNYLNACYIDLYNYLKNNRYCIGD